MTVTLKFATRLIPSDPAVHPVLIVGKVKNIVQVSFDLLRLKLHPRVTEECYRSAIENLQPADACSLYLNHAIVASVPFKCSRHNAPSRAQAVTRLVRSHTTELTEYIVLIVEKDELFASACAIARTFPKFTCKSSKINQPERTVTVEILLVNSAAARSPEANVAQDEPSGYTELSEADLLCLNSAADAIQLAGRIIDEPCGTMHTDAFIEEIKEVGRQLNLTPDIIRGDELRQRGFGGLDAVGRTAIHQPALVVLSYYPPDATRSIAWVGKGIVYDTGGLSMKAKTTMPGMKRDCGGAAAILGAFYSAVKQGFKETLHAVFCLAENAVGPNALRPDDIITLYSQRTVEVNNTDAEGRLVLGDGVSYASKDLKADIIVDLATLTGAQGVATGRLHGALVTNKELWEKYCVSAGRYSADLVHPLIYSPELHFGEFASAMADMKNSSSDRSNAEVSCAGLFIAAHLGFDFPGVWIHVDMAYPVYTGERATGYGVGLLLMLFGQCIDCNLLRLTAPPIYTHPPTYDISRTPTHDAATHQPAPPVVSSSDNTVGTTKHDRPNDEQDITAGAVTTKKIKLL